MPTIDRYSNLRVNIPDDSNQINVPHRQTNDEEIKTINDPGTPYTLLSIDDFEPPGPTNRIVQQQNMRAAAHSVDVRWQLFRLLEEPNDKIVELCTKMNPAELFRLGVNFTKLSSDDLGTFSTEQLTRLMRVFLGAGFVNARMKNPECLDISKADFDALCAKLPDAVKEALKMS